jgi:RNA polymerase sigma-70 factor (ECF subfamily)
MTQFGDIYRRYAGDVHRFVIYLTGNRAEADDIVSETFLRAWATPDELRAATVKAYLLTIARNLCRSGVKRRRLVLSVDVSAVDGAATPEASAVSRDALTHAIGDLQRLAETDRAALLLRVLEDLPYDDIAIALGLSVANAKVRVHRARARLVALRAERMKQDGG